MNNLYRRSEGSSGFPQDVTTQWINESWYRFRQAAGLWILAVLIGIVAPLLIYLGLYMHFSSAFMQSSASAMTTPLLPHSKQYLEAYPFGFLFDMVMLFFYSALLRMAIKQVRGYRLLFKDIFAGAQHYGQFLGYSILSTLLYLVIEAICFFPFFLAASLSHPASSHASPVLPLMHPFTWTYGSFFAAIGTNPGMFALSLTLLLLSQAVTAALIVPGFALVVDEGKVFSSLRRSVQAMKSQWLPGTGLVLLMGLIMFISYLFCGLGLLVTVPMAFLTIALVYRDRIGMPNMAPAPAPVYQEPQPGVWPPPPIA